MADERHETPADKAKNTSPLSDFVAHQRKAAEETCAALAALVPPDFRTHSKEARKEFLMSFKVLADGIAATVDHEINRMRNAPESGSGPSTTGKTKVKIEVS